MSKLLVRFLLITFALSFSIQHGGQAQRAAPDSLNGWDFGGNGAVNFSQVSLNNWAAGGQSSVSVLGTVNLFSNYRQGKNTVDNNLDLTYGTIKLNGQSWRKNDDRLEFNTKYGRNASSRWYYTAQLNLRTQFAPTYSQKVPDSLVSRFFSPAVILASLGMDYKPNKKFSVLLSPFTGKLTIVGDQELADAGAFGVKPAEKDALGQPIPGTGAHLRQEFGGFVNVRYREEVLKNVTWQSKLDLFSNYLRNPQNIDVNWENTFDFKVNRFISANLLLHMIYDDDIVIKVDDNDDGVAEETGPRLQLRQTLGIGLSYKIN